VSFEAYTENLSEDRPTLWQQKCRPVTPVCDTDNLSFIMWIFAFAAGSLEMGYQMIVG